MHTSDILQILVGGGVLGGALETVRWFFGGGRGKARIDNASAVEAMAIDLLKPLNDQVQRTTLLAENLQANLTVATGQVHRLQDDLEALSAWAVAVRAILDEHSIPYPPVPQRRS